MDKNRGNKMTLNIVSNEKDAETSSKVNKEINSVTRRLPKP